MRKEFRMQDIRLNVPHAYQCNICHAGELKNVEQAWFPNQSGGMTLGSVARYLHECGLCGNQHWMETKVTKLELRMQYSVQFYQSKTETRIEVI